MPMRPATTCADTGRDEPRRCGGGSRGGV